MLCKIRALPLEQSLEINEHNYRRGAVSTGATGAMATIDFRPGLLEPVDVK